MSESGLADPVEIFGTDEPVAPALPLSVGPLTLHLDRGQFRDIRFHGRLIFEGIGFFCRDPSWGTMAPRLSEPVIDRGEGTLAVSYEADCDTEFGHLRYRIALHATAAGTLSFTSEATAVTDFATARTGFVVMHTADQAGAAVTVEHDDGRRSDTRLPELVTADPVLEDIAAMEIAIDEGFRCRIRFSGESFETEDQRNWTDPSFKTFSRPLRKPAPYVIARGETDRQRVEVELVGQPRVLPAETRTAGQAAEGRLPRLIVFLDPPGGPLPPQAAEAAAGAAMVACRIPAGDGAAARAEVVRAADFARKLGAQLRVETVFPGRDAEAEARALQADLTAAGVAPDALTVLLARDRSWRPPRSLPEGELPMAGIVAAVRRLGLAGRIGGGVPAQFCEFNGNPPTGEIDHASFEVSAIVHEAEDVAVARTLATYPKLFATGKARVPGVEIWPGPCMIGLRRNPYGQTAEGDGRRRVSLVRNDPRQGALFAATFLAALVGAAAASGIGVLTAAAAAGPLGLVGPAGELRPVAHVHRLLAAAAGSQARTQSSATGVHVLRWGEAGSGEILVANLGAEELHGLTETAEGQNLDLRRDGWVPVAARQPIPPYGLRRIRT